MRTFYIIEILVISEFEYNIYYHIIKEVYLDRKKRKNEVMTVYLCKIALLELDFICVKKYTWKQEIQAEYSSISST